MQPRTNYTTYDQAYYYADVARMPLLLREERDQLLASYAHTTAPLDIETRNALVEGHVRIATSIVLRTCPHGLHDLIPDMIGAVNLALVEIVSRYHVEEGSDLTNYLAVCAEKITKRALSTRKLITVPYHAIAQAREQGTQEYLYNLQPVSLDACMERSNTDEVDEPLATPILPTDAAPERNSEQRAHIEAWLSYLSPLEQTIVRMRYGLSDDDEHAYSIIEIGRILGIARCSVDAKCRDALRRLKHLASGTATIVMQQGQPHVKLRQFKPPVLTSEQEAALMQHAQQLAVTEGRVTNRKLAHVSGFSGYHIHVFLQAHREQFPSCRRPLLPRAERFARLEQAYQELEAQGIHPTYQRLMDATHIGKQSVCAFFRARKQALRQEEAHQQRKRGNPHRYPKRRIRYQQEKLVSTRPRPRPLAPARLMLCERDTITGNYDLLSSLFYEQYRGYTIYSTEQGRCCIHGPGSAGCLRIKGRYVLFPDIEEAKTLIKWFLATADNTTREGMHWHLPRETYVCLNAPRSEATPPYQPQARNAYAQSYR